MLGPDSFLRWAVRVHRVVNQPLLMVHRPSDRIAVLLRHLVSL